VSTLVEGASPRPCEVCRAPHRRRSPVCSDQCAATGRRYRRYGITAAEYRMLTARQDGRCAICCRQPRTRQLVIDHDHKTGLVRGLLCHRCNHELLRAAHESADILRGAARYLDEPPAPRVLGGPRFVIKKEVRRG
jgi:Recombination endonuclease VII